MQWELLFFINSILFGVGLAMDAFSVALANGLNEPDMKPGRACLIAGIFAGFQTAMPLLGWLCVHTIASLFSSFQRYIPWIALALLCWIGGNMLYSGLRHADDAPKKAAAGLGTLLVQGVATSIDALSVGFTIAAYPGQMAAVEALLIGVVTFLLCVGGIHIGKRIGTTLSGKASILGGVILIVIGLEIFFTGIL